MPMTPILLQSLAILLTVGVFYMLSGILRDALESLFKERSSKRNPHSSPRMEELGFRCLNRDSDFWSRVLYQDKKRVLELQLCFEENAKNVLRFPVEWIHMSIFRHSEEERELVSRAVISHPKQSHRQTNKTHERRFSRNERLTDCIWSRSSITKKEEFESFLVCLERHEFEKVTGLTYFERAPFMSPLLKHLLVTLPDEKSHYTLY